MSKNQCISQFPGEKDMITLPPVAQEDAGLRLDQFLVQALGSIPLPDGVQLSRQRLQTLIEQNCVTRIGSATPITKKTYKVKLTEVYKVVLPEPEPTELVPEAIPLNVFYEDSDLIVINKPANMATHPAPGSKAGTLVHALLHHCKGSLSGIGGVERPGIVHRLDKGTSGLMVAAKNDATHAHLSAQFKDRTIERRYMAFCYGMPLPLEGEIEGNIGRNPKDRKKMVILRTGGKPAKTTYLVKATNTTYSISLVELKLYTGRTHQIRVHMSYKGFPLLGDPVYTPNKYLNALKAQNAAFSATVAQLNNQALHAYKLGFRHPKTGEFLSFECEFPKELTLLKEKLFSQKNVTVPE